MNADPSAAAAGPAPSVRLWGAAIVGAGGLLGLATALSQRLPVVDPVLAYGVAFTVVAGQTLLASEALPRPDRRLLWLLLPGVGVLLTLYFAGITGTAAACAVTTCLLCVGTLVGGLVGSRIEHPGHLVFVALVSAGVDALSVFHPRGLSHAVAESEAALSVLAMSFPMLGTDIVAPLLGVGDVAFCALYLAAARAHGLPVPRTRAALVVGFALTALLVVLSQLPIPALPLLGLAVVAAHPRARRPRPADLRAGLVGVGLLCVVAVVLYLRW